MSKISTHVVKRLVCLLITWVFLLTNCFSEVGLWTVEEYFPRPAQNDNLAPPSSASSTNFKEKFKTATVLLAHKALNTFIKAQIEKIFKVKGKGGLKTRKIDMGGVEGLVISIPLLLQKTGQFAHIGLGRQYGVPVIYIDSEFFDNKDFIELESEEISRWEDFRINVLHIERNQMRGWILKNIDAAKEKAREFHWDPNRLASLREKYGDKADLDFEYINTMLALYGTDDESDDVNLAAFLDSFKGFLGKVWKDKPGLADWLIKIHVAVQRYIDGEVPKSGFLRLQYVLTQREQKRCAEDVGVFKEYFEKNDPDLEAKAFFTSALNTYVDMFCDRLPQQNAASFPIIRILEEMTGLKYEEVVDEFIHGFARKNNLPPSFINEHRYDYRFISIIRGMISKRPILFIREEGSFGYLEKALQELRVSTGAEVVNIPLTPFSDKNQLIGGKMPLGNKKPGEKKQKFVYCKNVIPRLVEYARKNPQKPIYLVLDNIEAVPGETRVMLNELIRVGRLNVPELEEEVVLPDNLYIIGTMSDKAKIKDDAFLNRFSRKRQLRLTFEEAIAMAKAPAEIPEDFIAELRDIYDKGLALDKSNRITMAPNDIRRLFECIGGRIKDGKPEDEGSDPAAIAREELYYALRNKLKGEEFISMLREKFHEGCLKEYSYGFDPVAHTFTVEGVNIKIVDTLKDEDALFRETGLVLDRPTLKMLSVIFRAYKYGNKMVVLSGATGIGKTFTLNVFSRMIGAGFYGEPTHRASDIYRWVGVMKQDENGDYYLDDDTQFLRAVSKDAAGNDHKETVALSELNAKVARDGTASLAWWLIPLARRDGTILMTENPRPPPAEGSLFESRQVNGECFIGIDINPKKSGYVSRGMLPQALAENASVVELDEGLSESDVYKFVDMSLRSVIKDNKKVRQVATFASGIYVAVQSMIKDRTVARARKDALSKRELARFCEDFAGSYKKGDPVEAIVKAVDNNFVARFTVRDRKAVRKKVDQILNIPPNTSLSVSQTEERQLEKRTMESALEKNRPCLIFYNIESDYLGLTRRLVEERGADLEEILIKDYSDEYELIGGFVPVQNTLSAGDAGNIIDSADVKMKVGAWNLLHSIKVAEPDIGRVLGNANPEELMAVATAIRNILSGANACHSLAWQDGFIPRIIRNKRNSDKETVLLMNAYHNMRPEVAVMLNGFLQDGLLYLPFQKEPLRMPKNLQIVALANEDAGIAIDLAEQARWVKVSLSPDTEEIARKRMDEAIRSALTGRIEPEYLDNLAKVISDFALEVHARAKDAVKDKRGPKFFINEALYLAGAIAGEIADKGDLYEAGHIFTRTAMSVYGVKFDSGDKRMFNNLLQVIYEESAKKLGDQEIRPKFIERPSGSLEKEESAINVEEEVVGCEEEFRSLEEDLSSEFRAGSDSWVSVEFGINNKELEGVLKGHSGPVNLLSTLPDGRIVSGSDDKTIKIWDIPKDKVITIKNVADGKMAPGNLASIAAFKDGRIAVGCDDGTIKVLSFYADKVKMVSFKAHESIVRSIATFSSGKMVSASPDGTIKIWYPAKGGFRSTVLRGNGDRFYSVAAHPTGRIVSGSEDGTIRVWNIQKDRVGMMTLEGHTGAVWALTTSSDGKIISGSTDRTVRIWDVLYRNEGRVTTLKGSANSINSLSVLPDGRLVSGGFKNINIWDVQNDKITSIESDRCTILSVATFSDGTIVAGSAENTINMWKVPRLPRPPVALSPEPIEKQEIMLEADEEAVTKGESFSRVEEDSSFELQIDNNAQISAEFGINRKELENTLEGHRNSAYLVAALPDGRIVSAANDNTVKIWDIHDNKVTSIKGIASEKWAPNNVMSLDILRDGRIVLGCEDGMVKILTLTKDKVKAVSFRSHDDGLSAVSLFPDGRIIAAGYDGTVKIWSPAKDGFKGIILRGERDRIGTVAALPDGRVASGTNNGTIRIWDFANEKAEALILKGFVGVIWSIIALPNGKMATVNSDSKIRVWDIMTHGKRVKGTVLKNKAGFIKSLALLPDGKLVSGGFDETIGVWDLQNDELITLKNYASHTSSIGTSPDGRIISGNMDNTINVWRPPHHPVPAVALPSEPIQKSEVKFKPEEEIIELEEERCRAEEIPSFELEADNDARITMEPDVKKKELHAILQGHAEPIRAVFSLPEGKVASCGMDKTIRIWDLNGNQVMVLRGHTDNVNSIGILPDGSIMSAGDDQTVRIWNVRANKVDRVVVLKDRAGLACSATVLPDGKIAVGFSNNLIKIFDVRSGKTVILRGHTDHVWSVSAFSDGRIVSGSQDGTVRIWRIEQGRARVTVLRGHVGPVRTVSVTSDGKVISGGDDNTVRIWDANTAMILKGHRDVVRVVSAFPDGRVISGSDDATVRIWDIQANNTMTLKGHSRAIRAVCSLPDGMVMSGSYDKTAIVWNIPSTKIETEKLGNISSEEGRVAIDGVTYPMLSDLQAEKDKNSFLVEIDPLIEVERSILLAWRNSKITVLTGPPGVGKTEMASDIAKRVGLDYFVFQMRKGVDLTDWLGRFYQNEYGDFVITTTPYTGSDGKKHYNEKLLEFIANGGVFIADEGALGRDAEKVLQWVTDMAEGKKKIRITEHPQQNPVEIDVSEHFHLVITTNLVGRTPLRRPIPAEVLANSQVINVTGDFSEASLIRILVPIFKKSGLGLDDSDVQDLCRRLISAHKKMEAAIGQDVARGIESLNKERYFISLRELQNWACDTIRFYKYTGNLEDAVRLGFMVNYLFMFNREDRARLLKDFDGLVLDLRRNEIKEGNDALELGKIRLKKGSPNGSFHAVKKEEVAWVNGAETEEEVFKMLCLSMAANRPIMMLNEPGARDRVVVEKLAAELNYELYVNACNPDQTVIDILGGLFPVLKGENGSGRILKEKEGFITRQLEKSDGAPKILFLRNIDALDEDVRGALNALLLTGDLNIRGKNGEVVTLRKPENVLIVASVAVESRADFSSAFYNRFIRVRIGSIDYMLRDDATPSELERVLMALYDIPEKAAFNIRGIYEKLTALKEMGRWPSEKRYDFTVKDAITLGGYVSSAIRARKARGESVDVSKIVAQEAHTLFGEAFEDSTNEFGISDKLYFKKFILDVITRREDDAEVSPTVTLDRKGLLVDVAGVALSPDSQKAISPYNVEPTNRLLYVPTIVKTMRAVLRAWESVPSVGGDSRPKAACLMGRTGVSKTTLGINLAKVLGLDYYVFSVHGQARETDLTQDVSVEDGEYIKKTKEFLARVRAGRCVLVVDEANIRSKLMYGIISELAAGKKCFTVEFPGEVEEKVTVGPNVFVLLTMNPRGEYSEREKPPAPVMEDMAKIWVGGNYTSEEVKLIVKAFLGILEKRMDNLHIRQDALPKVPEATIMIKPVMLSETEYNVMQSTEEVLLKEEGVGKQLNDAMQNPVVQRRFKMIEDCIRTLSYVKIDQVMIGPKWSYAVIYDQNDKAKIIARYVTIDVCDLIREVPEDEEMGYLDYLIGMIIHETRHQKFSIMGESLKVALKAQGGRIGKGLREVLETALRNPAYDSLFDAIEDKRVDSIDLTALEGEEDYLKAWADVEFGKVESQEEIKKRIEIAMTQPHVVFASELFRYIYTGRFSSGFSKYPAPLRESIERVKDIALEAATSEQVIPGSLTHKEDILICQLNSLKLIAERILPEYTLFVEESIRNILGKASASASGTAMSSEDGAGNRMPIDFDQLPDDVKGQLSEAAGSLLTPISSMLTQDLTVVGYAGKELVAHGLNGANTVASAERKAASGRVSGNDRRISADSSILPSDGSMESKERQDSVKVQKDNIKEALGSRLNELEEREPFAYNLNRVDPAVMKMSEELLEVLLEKSDEEYVWMSSGRGDEIDFRRFMEGHPKPFKRRIDSEKAKEVSFEMCIDLSASMGTVKGLKEAVMASTALFIHTMNPLAEGIEEIDYALTGFHDGYVTFKGFGKAVQKNKLNGLLSEVAKDFAKGSTDITQALRQIIDKLKEKKEGLKIVCLITDAYDNKNIGKDTDGKAIAIGDLAKVLEEAEDDDIIIVGVGIGEEAANCAEIFTRYAKVRDFDELPELYVKIIEEQIVAGQLPAGDLIKEFGIISDRSRRKELLNVVEAEPRQAVLLKSAALPNGDMYALKRKSTDDDLRLFSGNHRQKTGFGEADPSISRDVELAKDLLGNLMYTQLGEGRIYEVRYDVSRLSKNQIAIIEEYVKLLQIRAGTPGSIKARPFSGLRDTKESLIAVYSRGRDFKGEGHIEAYVSEGELKEYSLRIVGMLNIAFAASNIPEGLTREQFATYGKLVGFIQEQYKAILGRDLSIPDSPEDALKAVRMIVFDLPKSVRMDVNEVDKYNQKAREALRSA